MLYFSNIVLVLSKINFELVTLAVDPTINPTASVFDEHRTEKKQLSYKLDCKTK